LWDIMRFFYEKALVLLFPKGIERIINGTDRILILHRFHATAETYEPRVWEHIMAHVLPGDIAVDVGAYIGFYTVSLAKHVGPEGKIFAFEPDPDNYRALQEHVKMNNVSDRVITIQAAAISYSGDVFFTINRKLDSRVSFVQLDNMQKVRGLRLDDVFREGRIDILKIDAEGSEEEVLKGASNLLQDDRRCPRLIYIEIHPYNWSLMGTTSDSILSLIKSYNYCAFSLDGYPVEEKDLHWSEIVLYKRKLTARHLSL